MKQVLQKITVSDVFINNLMSYANANKLDLKNVIIIK